MEEWAVVAVVAIVFGSIVTIFRMIFQSGRSRADRSASDATVRDQKELFDLALRLQNRVETLERLLDTTQPEWRGKP